MQPNVSLVKNQPQETNKRGQPLFFFTVFSHFLQHQSICILYTVHIPRKVIYMNGRNITIIIFSIVGLFLLAYGTRIGIDHLVKYAGIALGFSISLLAVVFHLVGNTIPGLHVFTFLMNSFTTGFSISSFYTYFDINISNIELQHVMIVAFITILVATLFQRLKYRNKYLLIFILLTFPTIITLWIVTGNSMYGMVLFTAIITFFFIHGIFTKSTTLKEYLKVQSERSFGFYAVVTIIVFIVISNGEALEGLGYGFDPTGSKRKTHRY